MGEVKAAVYVTKQRWFRSAPFWRIAGILLYLTCITVLGMVASSIFTYDFAPGNPIYMNISQSLPLVTEAK